MTKTETIATAVTLLAETFRQQLSETGARGYIAGLEDLTEAQIGEATKRALRECKFMPSCAELRALIGIGGPRDIAFRAAEAWEAVRTAMDRYDYTTNVDFGSHVNAAIRNLGGWQALCDKTVPELTWVRKDFERLYEAFDGKDMGDRGDLLLGAFRGNGEYVQVAIGGVSRPRMLPAPRTEISKPVRDLADAKS